MRNKIIRTVTLVTALCAVALLPAENEKPVNWHDLDAPYATPSAQNRPEVITQPDGAVLSVPAGFNVEVWAEGEFKRPRYMMLGPSNEVIMSDAARDGEGAVWVIHDGVNKKIISDLDRPFGLEMHEDWLYVAETVSIKRYRYDAENMAVTSSGEELYAMPEFGKGHWTRSLRFDPHHRKLYFSIGSESNVDPDTDRRRAALHRMNPDGTNPEIVAEGLRNTIGLRFHPVTGDLWAAVQERDGLGDNLVSDFVTRIEEGGFYGWPYAYSGPHEDPRREGENTARVESTLYPNVLMGAHVAVLGMTFYQGDMFPEKYRGGLFVAEHGSWNRADRTGYSIVYIPFENGTASGGPEDFLTGWMSAPDVRQVWGRPVAVLTLPDGSLLVSDDGANKVWRVSYGE